MAASILFVRVTRGVFADEVVGGLDRMATRALLPKFVKVVIRETTIGNV